ncbi:MAG: sulfide/dihydroorotate dehydrogenase-like FAD/NAD-binding protein [Nitrospiraceae bacterium]|nr:sulfide/dihydroorotate dehydrogenase-like FAD/NAD-binding protein [Nitrospiraceae bacterium]
MAEIVEKKLIRHPDVFYYRLYAPLIAAKAKPGQFVIIRIHEKGERIPLSLADIDPARGTISLIVMCVGKTTSELATLNAGDHIKDVCGPLGNPTHIENFGKVVLAGGGFGVAPLYPIGKALRAAGNRVVTVMGARNKDLLIYTAEMQGISDKVVVSTDDGSAGIKGVITDALGAWLEEDGADLVMAVGPAPMMEAVCRKTASFGVKTIVSLNAVMIDGTGMCGGCRVVVGGEVKFVCMDGPDFDGHLVDWDLLMARQKTYVAEEKKALEISCSCGGESHGQ